MKPRQYAWEIYHKDMDQWIELIERVPEKFQELVKSHLRCWYYQNRHRDERFHKKIG